MQLGEFCWNELATPDLETAKEFYGKLFGWQFKEIKAPDVIYNVISTGEKDFAGIWQIPDERKDSIPPHWMAYVLVPDVTAALKKAEQLGAIIAKDVTQVGEMGYFGIVVDPTGAHIALWQTINP